MFLPLLAAPSDVSAPPGHFQLSPRLTDEVVSHRAFNFSGEKKKKDKRSSSAILYFKWPLGSKCTGERITPTGAGNAPSHLPAPSSCRKTGIRSIWDPFRAGSFSSHSDSLEKFPSKFKCSGSASGQQQRGFGENFTGISPVCVPSVLPRARRLCHVQK